MFSGQLFRIEQDLVSPRAGGLSYTKIYDGGSEVPNALGYGWGSHFAKDLFFLGYKNGKKYVFTGQQEHSQFLFNVQRYGVSFQGVCSSKIYDIGYCNTVDSLLMGEPPFPLTKVFCAECQVKERDKPWTVTLPNGTKRTYTRIKKPAKYSNCTLYWFVISKEKLPNGLIRHYSYFPNSNIFKKIWVTNSDSSRILDELNFDYGKLSASIELSNGRRVGYSTGEVAVNYTLSGKIVFGLKRSSGKHLLNHYYQQQMFDFDEYYHFKIAKINLPGERGIDFEYYDVKGRSSYGMIKELKIPKNQTTKEYETLFTFKYFIGSNSASTEVVDAYGNKNTFYNKNHRLVKIQQNEYRTFNYEWDQKGNLLAKKLKGSKQELAKATQFTYDSSGNVNTITEFGTISHSGKTDQSVHSFTYDSDNRYLKTSETFPNGTVIRYGYQPGTNLMTSELTIFKGDIKERIFHTYDESAILVQTITDDGVSSDPDSMDGVTYRLITENSINLEAGTHGYTLPESVSEYAYDALTEEKILLQRKEIIYTSFDLVSEEKIYDSNNCYAYSMHYSYNDAGLPISKTNRLGEETRYQYDANHNVTQEETIGSGKYTQYFYDRNNRLTMEKVVLDTGEELISTYTYDLFGNRLSEIDSYGAKTTYEYDAYSRRIKKIDACGNVYRIEYDLMDHPIKEVDPKGNVTTKVYNIFGKPLEILYPDGTHEVCTYDLSGNLVKKIDIAGTSTHYLYDYQNRVILEKVYDSGGVFLKEHSYRYKGRHLVSETDSLGVVTDYVYDAADRLIFKKREELEEYYLYDVLGRKSHTIRSDRVDVKEYDLLDRVIEDRVEDFAGEVYRKKTYVYDINGNLISEKAFVSENEFSETQTLYNGLNEIVFKSDSEGNETRYHYIRKGYLETIKTDPLGQEEHAHFDHLQRLDKNEIFHSGCLLARESCRYDLCGNKISHLYEQVIEGIPQGAYIVQWEHDSMGRVIKEIEQGDKTTRTTYLYGRKETITKPDGVTLYHTYDGLGRLITYSSSDKSINYSYQYNGLDNLLKVEDHVNQGILLRHYDCHGRMVKEILPAGYTSTYRYDSLNRLTQMTFPDNSTVDYVYNVVDLTQVTRGNGTHVYAYDLAGNLNEETCFNGEKIAYVYDANQRLIEKSSPHFHQSLVYDQVGNVVYSQINQSENYYSYDPLYQLLSEEGRFTHNYTYDSINNRLSKDGRDHLLDDLNRLLEADDDHYTYDENGNRLTKNQSTYRYDALNRLTVVDQVFYGYDSFGRLLSRNQEEYLYFNELDLGTPDCLRIVGKGTIGIEKNGKLHTVITDDRGSVSVVLDGQNTVAAYEYGAFGESIHSGDFSSPWEYSSQRVDTDTHLLHFFKRVYDPIVGRWLTPDPAGYVDGPNLYAYVNNNPMKFCDPYGLSAVENQERTQGTFFGSFAWGAFNDTSYGLADKAFGSYECDNWQSKLGYGLGTATSLGVGLFYGSTEFKIAGKALGYTGKGIGRLGRMANLWGREVKAVSQVEGTVAKVARAESISAKGAFELNQFDRAASQLSSTGKDNIRILRGWAKSKGWTKYSEAGKPEKWGVFKEEFNDFVWHLRIKPEASLRNGLHQGSNIPRFDARISIDPKRGSTYINPYRGITGSKDIGTHIPLEKVHY